MVCGEGARLAVVFAGERHQVGAVGFLDLRAGPSAGQSSPEDEEPTFQMPAFCTAAMRSALGVSLSSSFSALILPVH
jgi:hypothetical protein